MSKTTVQALKDKLNARMAAPGGSREARLELASYVEGFMHEANCYKGFRYLEMNWDAWKLWDAFVVAQNAKGGWCEEVYNGEYKRLYEAAFGDDSRRYYY